MSRARSSRASHRPDPVDAERTQAGAPALSGRAPGMTPAQVIALQRAGAGNHALARVLARELDDDDAGEGGGQPLLLKDRPEWPIVPIPPPLPLAQPEFDFDLPIIIPREHVPPAWRWLFGIADPGVPQEPPPQLLIEYKPLVPEEAEEPEPEPEPVEAPKPKKRKKRKKKPAGPTPEAATEQPKPVATPPPRPAAQPQPKTASTPLWALSPEEAEAAITGSSPSKKTGAATQAGKSEGQKRHEKEHAARAKKREEEDARLAAADKGRKLAEQLEETKARAGLIAMLGGLRTNLTAARDALPDDDDHDAIYDEADEGVTALSAFLDGPGKTASSVTLNGKVEAIKSLISKVRGFRPPETPEQRRARRFEEVKTNVGLAFGRADWRGRYGGEADFTVDKTDIVMRDMIVAHYGRDTNEIPGHAAKDYPDRTPTSKVYYYVTGSSHTLGIAYDISLHAYDGDTQLGTVHVLHIRHRDE